MTKVWNTRNSEWIFAGEYYTDDVIFISYYKYYQFLKYNIKLNTEGLQFLH